MSGSSEPGKGESGRVKSLLGCGLVGFLAVAVAVVVMVKGPSHGADYRDHCERETIALLRALAVAQTTYRQQDRDGDGKAEFATPYTLLRTAKLPNGKPLKLISEGVAGASGLKGKPLNGYVLLEVATVGGKKVDSAQNFAICAIPIEGGAAVWRTFVVSADRVVRANVTGPGVVVKDLPADPEQAGWSRAE